MSHSILRFIINNYHSISLNQISNSKILNINRYGINANTIGNINYYFIKFGTETNEKKGIKHAYIFEICLKS